MASAREILFGNSSPTMPRTQWADAPAADQEDSDLSQGRQKEEIEFIPLPSNAGFFTGEARSFPYLYYAGMQRTLDYSRIDIFFSAIDGKCKVTLTGYGLKGLFLKIKARMCGTVRQVDAMHAAKAIAADPDATLVTGLTVGPVEMRED